MTQCYRTIATQTSLTLVKGVMQSGPCSHSQAITNLISVFVNFLCGAFCGNGIMCYIDFYIWLLLLNIVCPGLFLLVMYISSSFFLLIVSRCMAVHSGSRDRKIRSSGSSWVTSPWARDE